VTVNLSPLVHIEIVVPDADEAYRFLNKVFGAEKTQIEFANFLDGPAAHVVHVELGGVVLQFIEPRVEGNSWSDFLKEKGAGVHNLTFTVENMEETVKAMEEEGAPVLFTFPLDWSQMESFLPPGASLKKDIPPVHMMGGHEKVGFRFELAESPVGRDISPSEIQ